MSCSHLLTTKPSTTALLPTLTTTPTSPQPRPTTIHTLAALPLQTPDSKWRIQMAGCEPTCQFPPSEPSPRPLLHAAAIQIPGSQWRLALKTKFHLHPSSISESTSTPPDTSRPPAGPKLGKALRILQTSQSDASQAPPTIRISDDTQTGPPEKKRTYLDALTYENAIRMQLALKPSCRKLERKMGYLRRWKDRWAKFDRLRRVLGSLVEDESKNDGPMGGKAETEGGTPTWHAAQILNSSHGDWRRILWPSLPDLSLAPDKNHNTLTASREIDEERRRGGRRWLDELEREWWGDGFPMLVEGGDREGWECWLDAVD